MAKGFVAITVERCKGCGFCVEFCPTHVLALYLPPSIQRVTTRPMSSPRRNAAAATCAACTAPTSPFSEAAMHADPKGVLTGVHFLDGDHACCEGTLAAGARFAAGYPITPSTEVVERFAARIPTVGGIFIQMEDELAASIAIQGAVWGGAKAFTVTSGPGLFADDGAHRLRRHDRDALRVRQRAARRPFDRPAHAARAGRHDAGQWGSHGDYGIIALCPNSPQECFDLDHHGLQPRRGVPRAGDDDARRVRRPHDGEGGHPRSRARSRSRRAASPRSRPASTGPSSPATTWCRTW